MGEENEAAETTYRFTLSSDAQDAVSELMVLMGNVSMSEAIRKAIGDALFLRRMRQKGWRPAIERDGQVQELIWGDER